MEDWEAKAYKWLEERQKEKEAKEEQEKLQVVLQAQNVAAKMKDEDDKVCYLWSLLKVKLCVQSCHIAMLPFLGSESCTTKKRPTKRAPDWWESARFWAVSVTWSWFRQSGVISSRPPAGNANRWAAKQV